MTAGNGQVVRCPGSDQAPARTYRDRAECRWCHQRFAPKTDGMIRRHPRPETAPARKVTQK